MGLISIKCAGEIDTHIASNSGNYETVCGMDGDDPDKDVDQRVMPATGVLVTCQGCIGIWRDSTSIRPDQINQ